MTTTHPLAAVHALMPPALRESSPLEEWPRDAVLSSARWSGVTCQSDAHIGQDVPGMWHELIQHDGQDEHGGEFSDGYAAWRTCAECHDAVLEAQAAQDAQHRDPAAPGVDEEELEALDALHDRIAETMKVAFREYLVKAGFVTADRLPEYDDWMSDLAVESIMTYEYEREIWEREREQ
ncbi:hypothetical protein ACFY9F_36010 [Streptomyces sp. NPDC012421]|uniref:hypothetical protein n=1 Tax=Streptomyces sp. NPDC012421 TaxID=3364832 RepID=UPI0036E140B8